MDSDGVPNKYSEFPSHGPHTNLPHAATGGLLAPHLDVNLVTDYRGKLEVHWHQYELHDQESSESIHVTVYNLFTLLGKI